MKDKAQVIQQLLEIAQNFESVGDNEKGQNIRDLIADVNSNKKDHALINIQARVQIDKFDGDDLNQSPVETTEFISDL